MKDASDEKKYIYRRYIIKNDIKIYPKKFKSVFKIPVEE